MITMGFCERLSDNLMLKMCGKLIDGTPTYAHMFDHLSRLGYQVVVYHPFVPEKRWTASVYYQTASDSGFEHQIKNDGENSEVEYLQFDDWKEAADCGILLAAELIQKHVNMGLKLEDVL